MNHQNSIRDYGLWRKIQYYTSVLAAEYSNDDDDHNTPPYRALIAYERKDWRLADAGWGDTFFFFFVSQYSRAGSKPMARLWAEPLLGLKRGLDGVIQSICACQAPTLLLRYSV